MLPQQVAEVLVRYSLILRTNLKSKNIIKLNMYLIKTSATCCGNILSMCWFSLYSYLHYTVIYTIHHNKQ